MPTPLNSTPKFQKFLFKGHAIAMRGSIRKPYFQDLGNHLEVSTYAGSAGHWRCVNDKGFSVTDLAGNGVSYDSASTEILAEKVDANTYRCMVTSQVVNLRIGKHLTVDKVVGVLTSQYDASEYPKRMMSRISPAGSIIQNLKIDGKAQELHLPPAFSDQKTQDKFFKGGCDDDPAFHPGPPPPSIVVPGVGTIFYAEWVWQHPDEKHRQHITMLRLALGSDFGGDNDTGVVDNDGTGWPPVS